jgi:hypothetical protein
MYYDFEGNNRNFTDNPAAFSEFDYKMDNYSVQTGFEHFFGPDSKVLLQAGYRYSETDSTQRNAAGTFKTSGDGDGWVAVFELRKRFDAFLLGLEASQDVFVSAQGSNYDSTRVGLWGRYEFTRRLNAQVNLRYYKAYAGSNDDEFIEARDTRTYFIQTRLSYKLYRWLDMSAGHQYRYTDYKREGESLHTNVLFLDLIFTPTRPLVLR